MELEASSFPSLPTASQPSKTAEYKLLFAFLPCFMVVKLLIIALELSWIGHVIRMAESRLYHRLLYSELSNGCRLVGQLKKQFVDQVKSSILQKCNINATGIEKIAKDRFTWKMICKAGLTIFMLEWTNAFYRRGLIRHAATSRILKPTMVLDAPIVVNYPHQNWD
ncbi:hypothetical protein HELRODRAFT_159488 [Helobdella robusta]|uniref:Uncharacterized protein n=1 Tax=Helobdella robusta TaxID=6412 RepID=T1EP33_HELRO|nr:hypothetical protein HELRODRAFT_159488 [Helobdella robusta]ESO12901.1 hypothetical protein HELRODRAFT_159488 [Helobdella robusta]